MVHRLSYFLVIGFAGLCTAQTCPNITVPAADADDVSVSTDISWNAVEGASGYYLLVGTTPGGRDLVDRVDVGNNTTYELPAGESYPANTLISVKVTVRFPDRPDQTCPFELFTTGNAESQQGCGHFINQIQDFYACDQDGDNSEVFNLDLIDLERRLIHDQAGLTITYYNTEGETIDLVSRTVFNEETIVARATNADDCDEESSFRLIVSPRPNVVVLENINQCESYILNEIEGVGNYFTGPLGSGTPLFEGDLVSETQQIYIYAKTDDCEDESSFVITIDPEFCQNGTDSTIKTKFPNFFTPNNDGFNDFWQCRPISDTDIIEVQRIDIYDRYGRLISQLDPRSKGWDGTFNGKRLPESDYWFQAVFFNGNEIKGHFTLKR